MGFALATVALAAPALANWAQVELVPATAATAELVPATVAMAGPVLGPVVPVLARRGLALLAAPVLARRGLALLAAPVLVLPVILVQAALVLVLPVILVQAALVLVLARPAQAAHQQRALRGKPARRQQGHRILAGK